jgi:hypothetical protein
MPQFLEKILRGEAKQKGFRGKRADKYVYGAMNNMGAMRGNQITAKGAAMDAKHARDMALKAAKPTARTPKPGKLPKVAKTPTAFAYDWRQHQGRVDRKKL